MHLAHEVVGLEHPAHAVGKAERDGHGQALGHGHHDQRHCNHDGLEHVGQEGHPVVPVEVRADDIGEDAAHHDEEGEGIAQAGDPLAEPFELFVERRFHAVVYLRRHEDLALLRLVSDALHAAEAVAFHHLGALHHVVGGVGGVGVSVVGVGAFRAGGFARQRAFVHAECGGFEEHGVGGDFLARVEHHHVADHDVAARHLRHVAVADDFHRLVVVHLVEDAELLVGLEFEVEGKSRGQEDGYEDAYRLKEHLRAFAEAEILVERNAHRGEAGDEEDNDERVAELFEKLLPERVLLGRGERVGPVFLAAFGHLGVGEAREVGLLFHVGK